LYKRLYYNSIVTDKLIVEVIKTKEGLDPFYSIRGFLVTDYFNLFRVNFNFFCSNNKPKVLYTLYPKFIFLNINL
jgi:hypothetical protein